MQVQILNSCWKHLNSWDKKNLKGREWQQGERQIRTMWIWKIMISIMVMVMIMMKMKIIHVRFPFLGGGVREPPYIYFSISNATAKSFTSSFLKLLKARNLIKSRFDKLMEGASGICTADSWYNWFGRQRSATGLTLYCLAQKVMSQSVDLYLG